MQVEVKAAGGATKWGIVNLEEIQKIDPGAKLSDDKHRVILSDGRILKPREIVKEQI